MIDGKWPAMRRKTRRDRILSALLGAVLAVAASAAARAEVTVVDLPLGGGASLRVQYLSPARPVAALVLFPGGDGIVGLGRDGAIAHPGNFLVRTRQQWVDQGFAVAIPDLPSDRPSLRDQRLSPSYGDAIGRIVVFLRGRTSAPIWLVGASSGTAAAANGAGRLGRRDIAGLVLAAPVTRPAGEARETVFGADLGAIAVPVLILSHDADRCKATPPADRPRLAAALTAAPRVEIATLGGGPAPAGGPCDAQSPHGFFGVEAQAVGVIAAWIRSD